MQKQIIMAVLAGLFLTACQSGAVDPKIPADSDSSLNWKSQLFEPDEIFDAVALLPPPPKAGSALEQADIEAYREGQKLKGTELWERAREGARTRGDDMAAYFIKYAGVPISKEATPTVYQILDILSGRTTVESSIAVKKTYMRLRPYRVFNESTCTTKEDEDKHRDTGSYPSNHSNIGWTDALILSELFPDCQDAILQAGYEYGVNRIICGYHWKSDVDSSRLLSAAVVARLHSNEKFMALLDKAKQEAAALTAEK